jgi:putative exosortase-associated protein (TIGR04073 family)
MRGIISLLAMFFLATSLACADIHLPKRANMYDKLGRGIANIVLSPAEIIDSQYTVTKREGSSAGFTKGVVQGSNRMLLDIGVGIFETATFFVPTEPIKWPACDTDQVNVYPPSDLENWY